ncbi:MAG: ATP-binding protein [Clostridia bacterium]|nr:ATP-binding protein [Clostridia bacterium]
MLNEIVVISGKGGTGKTTLVAAMLAYLDSVVVADCDVDAPDLHILLHGEEIYKSEFSGLQRPTIDKETCISCGLCHEHCKFNAITEGIDLLRSKCEGCSLCAYICPTKSITMQDAVVGTIYHRSIANGDFVYGRLIPGEETSGKLVSAVRQKAKQLAHQKEIETMIIDGAPGIACNVIASITGASQVVIVTEPTVSGLHDLQRVYELVQRFRVKATVVVNKSDLSDEGLQAIRNYCHEEGLLLALEIPFNRQIVESISALKLPPEGAPEFYRTLHFEKFMQSIGAL